MALNNRGALLCIYKGKSTSSISCTLLTEAQKQDSRDGFLTTPFIGSLSGAFISPIDQSITINQLNEVQLDNYARSVISEIQSGLITTISPEGVISTIALSKEVFTDFSSRPADFHEYIDINLAEFRWNGVYNGKLVQLRVAVQKTSAISDITFSFVVNESPIFGSWYSLSELCISSTKPVKIRLDKFPDPATFYEIGDTLPIGYPFTVAIKTGNSLSLRTMANYPQLT